MMIPRTIAPKIEENLRQYPIVAITGPRQSGKTTLVRNLLSDYTYGDLELSDVRDFAASDPRSFLDVYQGNVIFDEIQKSAKTIYPDFFKGLNYIERIAPNVVKHQVYGGNENYVRSGTRVTGFDNLQTGVTGNQYS